MKKLSKSLAAIVPFLMMMSTFQTAQSQILISLLLGDKLNSPNLEFGLEGGFNSSYLSGIDESKGFGHLHLGFYFDIRVKEELWFNTGVRVKSNMGAKKINPYSLDDPRLDTVFLDGHVNRDIGYWYVPIHLKYRFGKSKQFFVQVGGQIGLRNKANDSFYNTYYETDDVSFKFDIGDYIKRIDAGVSGGLGYKFNGSGMNLGIIYYYGLMNIMKPTDLEQYNYASKNSSLYIFIDIPIGAGYKEQKNSE
jgi:hypothetical protein